MTDLSVDDASLVAGLGRGESAPAHELYARYGAALLRFAIAMTHNRQTAEDIVHDAFVELLRQPDRYDPTRGSVVAYLFGIARHRMARVARESIPMDARPSDTSREERPDSSSTAGDAEEFDRYQLIERVRAAVLDLPTVHREVVALCDLEELPYATVAAILTCPIGTVRSRLHRARALLAVRLMATGTIDVSAGDASDLTFACRGTPT
jgi:RNA polymerase sigma factor (sigma-70 family)